MTISDLSIAIVTSRQNLTNKLNRYNFSEKELQQIAEALVGSFGGYFIFKDGEKI